MGQRALVLSSVVLAGACAIGPGASPGTGTVSALPATSSDTSVPVTTQTTAPLSPTSPSVTAGTIVTTTYGHWEAGQEPYILSVRFKMAELDKLYRAKLQGGKRP